MTTEKRRDGLSGCRKRLSKQGELQERNGTEQQEEALTTRRERTLGTAECAMFKTRKWEGSRRWGSRVQVPTSSRYKYRRTPFKGEGSVFLGVCTGFMSQKK